MLQSTHTPQNPFKWVLKIFAESILLTPPYTTSGSTSHPTAENNDTAHSGNGNYSAGRQHRRYTAPCAGHTNNRPTCSRQTPH